MLKEVTITKAAAIGAAVAAEGAYRLDDGTGGTFAALYGKEYGLRVIMDRAGIKLTSAIKADFGQYIRKALKAAAAAAPAVQEKKEEKKEEKPAPAAKKEEKARKTFDTPPLAL